MSDIKKRICEFCKKESSAPCEIKSQSDRCSRMWIKIKQTVLRFLTVKCKVMKPDYKQFYETLEIGTEVEYMKQRMTVVNFHYLSNGLIQVDLESDSHIHRKVPNWCCTEPKYRKNELVPSFFLKLKSFFK